MNELKGKQAIPGKSTGGVSAVISTAPGTAKDETEPNPAAKAMTGSGPGSSAEAKSGSGKKKGSFLPQNKGTEKPPKKTRTTGNAPSRLQALLSFALLTLAGIVNALGVTLFLYPVRLYDSGISGTSMLLGQLTPEFLPLSFFLIVLNFPLFLYGLKKQGPRFTVRSLYAVAVYSLSAFFITNVLPIPLDSGSPLAGDDLVLCALFGGTISGVGSGLVIRAGGAIDGIEVMAVIFAKRRGLTIGSFVLIYNVILYIICGLIFHSWQLPLYSIVCYTVGQKATDFMVEGIDRVKAATIITTQPDKICQSLAEQFAIGSTRMEVTGGFSGEPKTMVYFVVNRFQIGRMREIVHAHDPQAYISITDVADVYSARG